MSYVCASCGDSHSELSRYFKWRIPKLGFRDAMRLKHDNDFMCRIGEKRHFIQCELELPFPDASQDPLGFICWVQVPRETYDSYLNYRVEEESLPPLEELVHGTLANPIPGVPGSLGIAVAFQVIAGDPTPYIRWVEPGSSVAVRLAAGATNEFWHEAAGLIR